MPNANSDQEQPEEEGRIYFITKEGKARGTVRLKGEGEGFGSQLLTVPLTGSQTQREGIIASALGKVRVFNAQRTLVKEIFFKEQEVPTLSRNRKRDPSGLYRVWVGFPKSQRVYLLNVR